ncbi:Ig-like domain-containing protein [Gemmatimonas sp.]
MPAILNRYPHRSGALGRVLVATAMFATMTACADSTTESDSYVPVATSITIADPGLVRDGDVVALAATVQDQRQRTMTSAPVQFVTVDPTVAVVTGGNVLTALREGTTELVAVSGTVQQRRPIAVVLHPVTAIEVPTPTVTLLVNSEQRIVPTVRGLDGRVLTGRALTWESGNPAVARVSTDGLVTAVGAGETFIVARYGTITRAVVIQVAALATSYTVREIDGRTLPANVYEELITRDDGSKYVFVERLEAGTVTVGDRYTVNLTIAEIERTVFQGNTIERVIRRRTISDQGSVHYNWLNATARFESSMVGTLSHEVRPDQFGPRLLFRLGGTDTIWGLGLHTTQ